MNRYKCFIFTDECDTDGRKEKCSVCEEYKSFDSFRGNNYDIERENYFRYFCQNCNEPYCYNCRNSFKVEEKKCNHCDERVYICSYNRCSCGKFVILNNMPLKLNNGDEVIFPSKGKCISKFGINITVLSDDICFICKERTIHKDEEVTKGCCDFTVYTRKICCKKECKEILSKRNNNPSGVMYNCSLCSTISCQEHIEEFIKYNGLYYCKGKCFIKASRIKVIDTNFKNYDEIMEEHLSLIDE